MQRETPFKHWEFWRSGQLCAVLAVEFLTLCDFERNPVRQGFSHERKGSLNTFQEGLNLGFGGQSEGRLLINKEGC